MFRRQFALAAVLLLGLCGPVTAASHDPVILTVEGLDGDTEFSLAELEALGAETLSTTTIWSDGVQEFEGVSLLTLLKHLGVTDGTLVAKAINDYQIEVPVSDAVEDGPILAFRRNGAPMPVRDKGPLWLVYPYDQNPDYRSEVIYSRSIWQLERIEIRP